MSEFIGARISLISKSDIRYSGTLHNISSEDSTVSLENVSSFGTEERRTGDEFIAPSEQVYEYIVFRGSDVKDLRIEDAPAPKPMPPAIPNDPAILGARPRPANNMAPPQFQQGPPQGIPPQGGPGFNPNMPIPPGPGGWGPNGPPGPGNFPYPPPAGWYPPQGPGFGPGGPVGPGAPQWNNNFYPPGPAFAPGPLGPGRPIQGGPIGGPEPGPSQPGGPQELEPKSLGQPPSAPTNKPAPTGPSADHKPAQPAASPASAPTQAPVPVAGRPSAPSAPSAPSVPSSDVPAPSAGGEDASLMAATAAAKAAVASALSKVNATPQQAPVPRSGPALPVDNLTQKFNEMRVNATREPGQPHHNGSHQYTPRGRGRGGNYGSGPRRTHNPVPVPDTAFDFEASNQKFNKDDLVKEVIASGDVDVAAPSVASGAVSEVGSAAAAGDADPAEASSTYNKTRSFFDNISSEAKDRASVNVGGQKPGSREWRGEEQRKNMETFGQGSVDGNYRGYRGRGRGRGRGYGRGRGGAGAGYRQNNYNNTTQQHPE